MAEGALDHGATPLAIFQALRLDARYIDALRKRYNPAQPRVPPGHPDGGQWTSGGWGDAVQGRVAGNQCDLAPAVGLRLRFPRRHNSVPNVEVAPGVVGTRIDSMARVPLDPTFPYSIFHIPWIAYLSAEDATGVTLPSDILTERTPDGGLLMSATTDRLDPMNPEHARRARILAGLMIARFGASSELI